MKDGYLNKCKDCTKKDTHRKYEENSKSEEYLEKERKRCREKYKRLNYKERYNTENNILSNRCLHKKAALRGYKVKGKELHHWNYNFPLEMFILSRSLHAQIHKHTTVDYRNGNVYFEGIILTSSYQAKKLYQQFADEKGYNELVKFIKLAN